MGIAHSSKQEFTLMTCESSLAPFLQDTEQTGDYSGMNVFLSSPKIIGQMLPRPVAPYTNIIAFNIALDTTERSDDDHG